MTVNFNRSTIRNQGAAQDYYSGVIQCNIYVPNLGTAVLSSLSEAVIDGLTSVNASGYTDTFSVAPRVSDISGPTLLEPEDTRTLSALFLVSSQQLCSILRQTVLLYARL